MTNIHGVFGVFVEFLGGLALLGFLSKDTDPAFGHILQQPGMDDIQTVICISFCPTMPGKAARLAISGGFEFGDFRLDGEAEGLEAEAGVRCELRALGVVELDVSCIVVAGRPDGSIDQVLEDIGSRGATDDDLVRGEAAGGSREVLVRSRDLVQHFMHPFVSARRTLQHAIPFLSSLLYAGRISMSCPSGSVMK